ncbi:MAG: zinc-ribbon domain-containing protein [Oscillospiraceae bacterium]|nr:zinc-ribbon domain-containing protein [Oscillospiraceae bacterium]
MKCQNCGKELNENAKFCDQCGTAVAQQSSVAPTETNVPIAVNEEKIENDNAKVIQGKNKKSLNKKTIIIFGVIAVVIVLLIVAILSIGGGSEGNQNNNGNNNYVESNDNDFGNNEIVTAAPTEAITAAPVNDIEVVYDNLIYDRGAAVKIIDYSIQYTDNGTGLTIYITYEKVSNHDSPHASSFASNIYFYDAAGNIIDSHQALYVFDFKDAEIGKQYRDDCKYFGMSKANISAQAIARIEIGD